MAVQLVGLLLSVIVIALFVWAGLFLLRMGWRSRNSTIPHCPRCDCNLVASVSDH